MGHQQCHTSCLHTSSAPVTMPVGRNWYPWSAVPVLQASNVPSVPAQSQVVSLTAGICVMTWLFCYFAIKWSASLTPVLPSVSGSQLTAIASLGGTLMMARSPASAVSMMHGTVTASAGNRT
jgi:hypothetical protein